MMVLHIVLGLLLLVFPLGVLYLFDRKLMRQMIVAIVRMIGQLLVLCLMVWGLLHYEHWWLSLLWLLGLVGWSSVVVAHRCRLDWRRFLWPVGAGLLSGVLVVGLYLLFAVLPVQRAMDARWFVPLMALLAGHSMSMLILGLSSYCGNLKADEQQYEFLRGNGTPHLRAIRPFIRRAFQAVLAPTAANLSVLGAYAMPLLVCGLLLGGVQPINVFVVTPLLMIGCVASSVIALSIAIWQMDRKLFDQFGKLR